MSNWRILAVDDEPLNLEIIGEYLGGQGYTLEFAENAEAGLALIETAAPPIDLVILDRMMPGMGGMELLRRLKAHARFRDIPVIMQTAAIEPQQVREGIEAGAYYYLTKPYDGGALLAIVRAALEDVDFSRREVRLSTQQAAAIALLTRAEFRFRTMDEAQELAPVLASLTADPERVVMGLSELLLNAIEHGNLALSYAEKSQLKRTDGWEAEVARRQTLPEYRGRVALVSFERRASEAVFVISDQGDGFEWQRYLDFDPERAFDPNGRGIALAKAMSFSRLEYRGCGNTVEAAVALA